MHGGVHGGACGAEGIEEGRWRGVREREGKRLRRCGDRRGGVFGCLVARGGDGEKS